MAISKTELKRLQTFGDRLKRLRNDRGLAQEELARLIGVRLQTIQRYEWNKRRPRSEHLLSLAEFFEVSPFLLLRGGDSNSQPIDYKVSSKLLSSPFPGALKEAA